MDVDCKKKVGIRKHEIGDDKERPDYEGLLFKLRSLILKTHRQI